MTLRETASSAFAPDNSGRYLHLEKLVRDALDSGCFEIGTEIWPGNLQGMPDRHVARLRKPGLLILGKSLVALAASESEARQALVNGLPKAISFSITHEGTKPEDIFQASILQSVPELRHDAA